MRRTLTLERETLAPLSDEVLRDVHGGQAITVQRCTGLEPTGQLRCGQWTFTNCYHCAV